MLTWPCWWCKELRQGALRHAQLIFTRWDLHQISAPPKPSTCKLSIPYIEAARPELTKPLTSLERVLAVTSPHSRVFPWHYSVISAPNHENKYGVDLIKISQSLWCNFSILSHFCSYSSLGLKWHSFLTALPKAACNTGWCESASPSAQLA